MQTIIGQLSVNKDQFIVKAWTGKQYKKTSYGSWDEAIEALKNAAVLLADKSKSDQDFEELPTSVPVEEAEEAPTVNSLLKDGMEVKDIHGIPLVPGENVDEHEIETTEES